VRSSALSFDRFANDYAVSKQFAPEPARELSTWAMMLAGFAGLGYAGCRRARGSAPLKAEKSPARARGSEAGQRSALGLGGKN
jgi:hypothetical protein